MHALLRPPEGRPRAGLREGVPDRLDPVRAARRAARAGRRAAREARRASGWNGARLYGHDPDDGVGGFGAFFLLLDEPEVYGLPPDPVVTTRAPAGHVDARPRSRPRRAARRHRGRVPRRPAMSEPRRESRSVLRAADHQGAGLEAGDPVLLLHGRPRRARRRCSRSPRARRATSGSRRRRLLPRRRRRRRLAAPADLRPRPAGAVPEHAARLQGDLADERRELDPRRLGRRVERPPPRSSCSDRCQPVKVAAEAVSARSAARRSPPTPARCSRTPRSRSGTRRGDELPFVFGASAARAQARPRRSAAAARRRPGAAPRDRRRRRRARP